MMKSHYRRQLTDFSHHGTDYFEFKEKLRKPGLNQSKVDVLEEELRKGYRQEALTLNSVMENMTRLYLTRFQELEKELKSTKLELEVAEKQQMEAQRVQSELLHHNWELLRKLQKLRRTVERHQERKVPRLQTQPEITHWKLVNLKHGRHLT
ncbi:hypothetical protein GDO78_005248 [Eleutherodactylus coqui]|uniref:Uncharacterized protein n=1 Tax=Eleutherodactylus coqui TaxID=57060 RepID=A0A8J6FJJ7_ELECQ|nr:hypothetical protein GDO78_005248 [Eleutherodactylus coqui]